MNADDYVGINGDILGYNSFIYCNDNPVSGVDYSGHNVVWLHESESAGGFGHSGVLIQNENGEWYYFYWGPKSESLSLDIITGTPNGCMFLYLGKTGLDYNLRYTEELRRFIRDRIGTTKGRVDKISSTYYINGNFNPSFDYLLELSRKKELQYKLLTNNCVQVTSYALSKSYSYFNEFTTIIPENVLLAIAAISSNGIMVPRSLVAERRVMTTRLNTLVRMVE